MELPDISKNDLPKEILDRIGDDDFVIEPLIDGDLDAMGLGPRALSEYSTIAKDALREELAGQMDAILHLDRTAKRIRKRSKKRNFVTIIDELNTNLD